MISRSGSYAACPKISCTKPENPTLISRNFSYTKKSGRNQKAPRNGSYVSWTEKSWNNRNPHKWFVRYIHKKVQKKSAQFILKSFENCRCNNETSSSMWTVMDISERSRRRNERDRQRRAQETNEQREARSVQFKKLPELATIYNYL